jgi:gliding motility-associated-like protein
MSGTARSFLPLLLLVGLSGSAAAQGSTIIPFTSGPIPPCDTSVFTANVAGIGTLYPPGWGWWTSTLQGLTINITTDHPEYLEITVTSPAGTSLLLSAFNGAGGQNYTATTFMLGAWNSITSGTAPFTGIWAPQGGNFDVFDFENADGIWTITVVDTACVGGPNAGGSNPGTNGSGWNPGWFDGSSNNGGFTISFDTGPPPCMGGIPSNWVTLCPGESTDMVSFYSFSGYDMSYMMPDGWTPIPDPTAVIDPGQYYIQAYDPWDGCVYGASYEVYVVPEIELGPDLVLDACSGAMPVDLTAQFQLNGWESQSWYFNGTGISNGAASAVSSPGVYQMIAYNGGNCGDTALVTLNVIPDPSLGPDQTATVCPGGSTDLTTLFNTTGYAVQWYFNGSPIPAPSAATEEGVYEIEATAGLWCTDAAEVQLTFDTPPTLGADQSHELCSNSSLDLTALMPTIGLAASWTLMGAPVADPSSVSAAGIYQLVGSNTSGCMDTALVTVSAVVPPSLGADAVAAVCAGGAVDLTTYFATAGLSAIWTASGSAVPDPSSVSATGVYTLVVTNATGCSDTAQVDLTVAANPVLGPDQQVTECDGAVVDLTLLYATGSSATTWTVNGLPVADPMAVSNAGSYTLTATNAAGCSASATVTLVFDPTPALGSDHASAICEGSMYDLAPVYSTAGLTATWTLVGTAITDPSAVDVGGDYQIVATNAYGCSDTAVVSLTVNQNPSLGADQWFALCPWQTVDLSAVFPVGSMNALYALNNVLLADPTTVADSGTYAITITDANGCADEAMAFVSNVDCLCEADFVADARCLQDPALFSLQADSMVISAQWDFAGAADPSTESDPVVLFAAEGEVVVTLQATLGCGVVTVQRTITIQDCADSCRVFIPNAFTPNDTDHRNDVWWWVGECEPEDFLIYIFNRWGELIYSTEDPHAPWDGMYNGVMSQDGVYVYRLAYRMPYQEDKEVIGHVTLLR